MTKDETGSTNDIITCLLAGQLDDTHLGRHVAFYSTSGHRVHGVLRAVRRRGFTACVLTLEASSHWHLPPNTEVDVITQEATA